MSGEAPDAGTLDEYAALSARNRALLERMFEPGQYGRACVQTVADGASVRLIGTTLWSGSFRNRFEWGAAVFFALPRELDGELTLTPRQIMIDGDHACVRASGRALLKNGRRYDNDYCLCYRLAGGCIVALDEYLDTETVTASFGTLAERDTAPRRPGAMERQAAVRPASYVSSPLRNPLPAAHERRHAVLGVFDGAAADYPRRWLDLLADDVDYRVMGRTRFSGRYAGRAEVAARLYGPLLAALDGQPGLAVDHVGVDGEQVWVRARGHARTLRGERYDDDYCFCLRFDRGKVREATVYLDTESVTRAFGPA